MQKKIQLKNLDCANCARELEEEIIKIEGVHSASVDFLHQRILLEYESEATLSAVISAANSFERVRVVALPAEQKSGAWAEHRAEIIALIAAAVCLVAGIALEYTLAERFWRRASYPMCCSARRILPSAGRYSSKRSKISRTGASSTKIF